MKVKITENFCRKGSKKYKQLARATSKVLRNFRKNKLKKVIEIKRYIYKNYAEIEITYVSGKTLEERSYTHTINYFCYC